MFIFNIYINWHKFECIFFVFLKFFIRFWIFNFNCCRTHNESNHFKALSPKAHIYFLTHYYDFVFFSVLNASHHCPLGFFCCMRASKQWTNRTNKYVISSSPNFLLMKTLPNNNKSLICDRNRHRCRHVRLVDVISSLIVMPTFFIRLVISRVHIDHVAVFLFFLSSSNVLCRLVSVWGPENFSFQFIFNNENQTQETIWFLTIHQKRAGTIHHSSISGRWSNRFSWRFRCVHLHLWNVCNWSAVAASLCQRRKAAILI